MKTKKILTVLFVSIFAIFVLASSSWAGSPQSHRWEGVAIGIGAAILGKALFDAHYGSRAMAPAPQPAVIEHHYYQAPPEPAGHWETRKEWVPPEYKKVWNPGHYNHHGHWVKGHWIQVEAESGYWVEKEIWVPHY